MKRRATGSGSEGDDGESRLQALACVLAGLDDAAAVRAFLLDLCTPAELEAVTDRWRVVPLLLQGVPYREIHELTGVSVTTIGRVARTLERGTGGYALASGPRASTGERTEP
ncbi:YerC/YecD family TrpR-related protein [Pseudoxanthomonas sp.]|uniref:YerC/YecD family TrpR-related protein n=1 Tax=Pseudoxanthomonas sp. TaxID=1871049 RepID=UPI00258E0B43|nr:YerC/YecD family TrpR-related protein [Pseudoxanthomonas sp.]MCR6684818.1 YerC/YecD family TrpR-related protein [Pseudoxanthomonas sp.]